MLFLRRCDAWDTRKAKCPGMDSGQWREQFLMKSCKSGRIIIEHQLAHAVRDPNGRAYNRTAHLKRKTEDDADMGGLSGRAEDRAQRYCHLGSCSNETIYGFFQG